jgi:hypothetical protein
VSYLHVLVAAITGMDKDTLRHVLLANACVALFLCVDEEYQIYVTAAVTIGALGYSLAREQKKQQQQQQQDKEE